MLNHVSPGEKRGTDFAPAAAGSAAFARDLDGRRIEARPIGPG